MSEKPLHWRIPGKRIMIQYPQMGRIESSIWSDFLRNIPWDDVEFIDYAYRVGKPYIASNYFDPAVARFIEASTRLRIDAVVHRVSEIWLMEVKEIANLVAIGQLLSYQHYYIQEVKPKKPVYLGVVARDYKLNIDDVARRYGIVIFIAKPNKVIIVT